MPSVTQLPSHNAFAPSLLSRLPRSPRKVAVLRASRIGVFICTTPDSGPYRVVAHDVPCRPRGPVPCGSCGFGLRCLEGVAVPRVLEAAEAVFPYFPIPQKRSIEQPGAPGYVSAC